jgi:RimJ/RimL family protein N-acetyltransferase
MRTEPLSDTNERAALRYLGRSPYLNVFIAHVVLHEPSSRTRSDVVVATDDGNVQGVAYCGRQFAIAAERSALPSFAEYARRRRGERMIIGPRDTVSAFWELVARWHPRPRLVRDRQLVMMLDRERARPYDAKATVRHARPDESSAVAEGSALMVRQELDYDPRRGSPDFATAVRRMIDRKLWWVGLTDGHICFFCNIGPWCEQTVQLQGIWTPPALRGRGLATASLAAICERLLEVSPTVSLYVNDFNERAIALYRRVGFEHVGDFQTILF